MARCPDTARPVGTVCGGAQLARGAGCLTRPRVFFQSPAGGLVSAGQVAADAFEATHGQARAVGRCTGGTSDRAKQIAAPFLCGWRQLTSGWGAPEITLRPAGSRGGAFFLIPCAAAFLSRAARVIAAPSSLNSAPARPCAGVLLWGRFDE